MINTAAVTSWKIYACVGHLTLKTSVKLSHVFGYALPLAERTWTLHILLPSISYYLNRPTIYRWTGQLVWNIGVFTSTLVFLPGSWTYSAAFTCHFNTCTVWHIRMLLKVFKSIESLNDLPFNSAVDCAISKIYNVSLHRTVHFLEHPEIFNKLNLAQGFLN